MRGKKLKREKATAGKSYNGVKNFAPIKEIFEVKFVVDNE